MALLLKPIQKASGSSQTSVIVIDALDELDSPGKDDVPPILFDIASQLPKNVKLIITSRPENSRRNSKVHGVNFRYYIAGQATYNNLTNHSVYHRAKDPSRTGC